MYHTLCQLYRKVIWEPSHWLLTSFCTVCVGLVALLTNQQTNKSLTKHTQITADARNCPCCYAGILNTSIKCSHSCSEIPFEKQSRLDILNLKLQTLVSSGQCLKGFFRGMFKPSKPVTSNFSSLSTWHFYKVLKCTPKWQLCMPTFIYNCVNGFLFGTVTSWNLCWFYLLFTWVSYINSY
jgi:hypothetical protein